MTFNQDSKTIGVYTYVNYNKSDESKDNPNNPTNKKTILLICIIVGCNYYWSTYYFIN